MTSLVTITKGEKGMDFSMSDFISLPAWVILLRMLIDFEFESFYSVLKVGRLWKLL